MNDTDTDHPELEVPSVRPPDEFVMKASGGNRPANLEGIADRIDQLLETNRDRVIPPYDARRLAGYAEQLRIVAKEMSSPPTPHSRATHTDGIVAAERVLSLLNNVGKREAMRAFVEKMAEAPVELKRHTMKYLIIHLLQEYAREFPRAFGPSWWVCFIANEMIKVTKEFEV